MSKSCFGITVALPKGQGQRSGSRSKVEIQVIGYGQRSRSNFWSTAVNIMGSALSVPVQGVCPCVCNMGVYGLFCGCGQLASYYPLR